MNGAIIANVSPSNHDKPRPTAPSSAMDRMTLWTSPTAESG